MMCERPWKPEAVLRLAMGVMACVFAGWMLAAALHFRQRPGHAAGLLLYALTAVGVACMLGTLRLLRRPWALEHLLRQLFLLLGCFYVGIILGAVAQHLAGEGGEITAGQVLVGTVSFQGMALVLVRQFLREHELGWSEAFGLGWHRRQAVLFGLVAACAFLPVGYFLQQASGMVMTRLSRTAFRPEEQQAVQVLRATVGWFPRLAMAVMTIVVAPLAEEVLFRGILYPCIKQAGFPRLALWGTAAFFGAIHLNLMVFAPLMVLALVLTLLYERTHNLLAPIAAHSLFNALNFALLYVSKLFS